MAGVKLFELLGLDVGVMTPIFEVPFGVGLSFSAVRVFDVILELRPPPGVDAPGLQWRTQLGASETWRLPFAVLFGQRGWFDRFPTTIDAHATTVQLAVE